MGSKTSKLYHFHLSYAAQIARLAFAEKGVEYESFSLDILASYEHYEPWYLEICPAGVVPAFVDGEQKILGSLNIVRHLEKNYPGPSLTPKDSSKVELMEKWIGRQQDFPDRVLSIGQMKGKPGDMARSGISSRVSYLGKMVKKHPDFSAIYQEKIKDIKAWVAGFEDPLLLKKIDEEFEVTLDQLEAHLSDGRTWIVGDDYSIADIVWTVLIARMHMMGMRYRVKAERRPNIAKYLERAQARPSFKAASVHLSVDRKLVLSLVLRARLPFLKPLLKIRR